MPTSLAGEARSSLAADFVLLDQRGAGAKDRRKGEKETADGGSVAAADETGEDGRGAPERETALKAMEAGKAELSGLGSAMFFDALLQITMEGFFADPIYGGNRDKAAWKMIGYPGLPATYRDEIKTYFGKKYDKEPRSIADFS